MPSDQKLGLSLGILLVGVVAAFFFRHDPLPTPTLPPLKTAADLDRQIAAQSRAPYLETDATPPPQSTITDTIGADEFPEPQDGAGLVPDPIAGTDELTMEESPPISSPTETPSSAPREHLVQRGETLSSIAAKYLGSAQRYEEIFGANTDQLRNPNDVRPGMTLLIPDGKGTSTPTATVRATTPPPNDIATRETPPAAATGSKMFVPYRRPQTSPAEESGSVREAEAKPSAKRRLSVTPPRDGSIIR